MSKRVGYIRVSSADQKTDRQLEGIELDKIFTEKISGKDTRRPALQAMLEFIREDDKVFVHELSRLGRSMIDLYQLVEQITEKGAVISFVKEGMEFSTGQADPVKQAMFGMLSVFAQFERSLIKQRQAEGIASAKAKGKHLGRPAKLTATQREKISVMVAAGETIKAVAAEFEVSRATVYNCISKAT
ncbi:recombinase family protein [Desulfofustis glycolicus]|uniref:Site-specific DNA recombinase n=1 Tax=Desulfofustis glycolicus DSM 9705 TaxID=1121409 RepID=A0A1M5YV34_9BACT|nr:recombinase family protein [Desulfofustis glycolicus]SHI15819.1 Site-specific DNA recombinase [Desulfofustis glycolicus DSM 9705]